MTDQQHAFALAFLEQLPLEGWHTILDIGAGPGHQSEWFKQHGKEVTAVDLRPPLTDIPHIDNDAETLHSIPNEFVDAVWTHHAFEHMLSPLRALQQVNRVLKPNGWLFFTVPQINGTISSGHINSYDMPLVIYHLAMCGFDTRHGYFGKFNSHLRCAVRKVSAPSMETSVRALWDAGMLPESCGKKILQTGRYDASSLRTKWLNGRTHEYS